MDQSNTWFQTPRTSRTHSILWLSIYLTRKSLLQRQMISKILMVLVKPYGTSLLQLRNLSVGLREEPCIGFTQENSIENSVQDCLPYIHIPNGPCELFLAYPKWPCVSYVVWYYSSRIFYIFPYIMWLVTVSSDVTCCVTAWYCHSNPNSSSKNRIKENKSKIK